LSELLFLGALNAIKTQAVPVNVVKIGSINSENDRSPPFTATMAATTAVINAITEMTKQTLSIFVVSDNLISPF